MLLNHNDHETIKHGHLKDLTGKNAKQFFITVGLAILRPSAVGNTSNSAFKRPPDSSNIFPFPIGSISRGPMPVCCLVGSLKLWRV